MTNPKVCSSLFFGNAPFFFLPPAYLTLVLVESSHGIDEDFQIPPVLPYPRNQFFVSRPKQLEQLHNVLFPAAAETGHSRIAVLSGVGGIGKTQLAIEYAHTNGKLFTSIFWVRAENRELAGNSFVEIAQHLFDHQVRQKQGSELQVAINLSLPLVSKDARLQLDLESQQARKLIVQAVKEWLARKRNTEWLLIFDNLESDEVCDFIPKTLFGHVIITTRFQSAGRLGTTIMIEKLKLEPALRLLLHQSAKDLATLPQEGGSTAQAVLSFLC